MPIADTGIACRNAPACTGADTAIRRETAAWFGADDSRTSEAVVTSGRSHAFCRLLNGGALVVLDFQTSQAAEILTSTCIPISNSMSQTDRKDLTAQIS